MVAPGSSSSSLPVTGPSATPHGSDAPEVELSSQSNGTPPVIDVSAVQAEVPDDGTESSSADAVPLLITDLSAIPDEPPRRHPLSPQGKSRQARQDSCGSTERSSIRWPSVLQSAVQQTALGFLWAVLTPVATLLVLVLVFSRIHSIHTQGVPYSLYAFVGILCWSFFATALGQGGTSLLNNKALLSKTQFPREVLSAGEHGRQCREHHLFVGAVGPPVRILRSGSDDRHTVGSVVRAHRDCLSQPE